MAVGCATASSNIPISITKNISVDITIDNTQVTATATGVSVNNISDSLELEIDSSNQYTQTFQQYFDSEWTAIGLQKSIFEIQDGLSILLRNHYFTLSEPLGGKGSSNGANTLTCAASVSLYDNFMYINNTEQSDCSGHTVNINTSKTDHIRVIKSISKYLISKEKLITYYRKLPAGKYHKTITVTIPYITRGTNFTPIIKSSYTITFNITNNRYLTDLKVEPQNLNMNVMKINNKYEGFGSGNIILRGLFNPLDKVKFQVSTNNSFKLKKNGATTTQRVNAKNEIPYSITIETEANKHTYTQNNQTSDFYVLHQNMLTGRYSVHFSEDATNLASGQYTDTATIMASIDLNQGSASTSKTTH